MNSIEQGGKKKILFVIPTYTVGGTVSSLLSLLQSEIHEVITPYVFCIKDVGECKVNFSCYEQFKNLPLTLYFSNFTELPKRLRPLAFLIKIIKRNKNWAVKIEQRLIKKAHKEIEDSGFDAIVAFAEKLPTFFVSTINHPNKICWIHCDYARIHNNESESIVYDKFSKIVCVSKFTKDSFLRIFPQFANRTEAIHNIFNYEHILNNANASIDDSRFVSGDYTLLSIGRISEPKRFHVIPRIASSLVAKGYNIKWYILGPGREKKYLDMLIEEIRKYKMEDHVVWLDNKVNPYPYYKRSDVFVSTSSSEACPMVFNEAKLLGLPIVSADFGSAPEFLEGEDNCWISSVDNMDETIGQVLSSLRSEHTTNEKSVIEYNKQILEQLKYLFS